MRGAGPGGGRRITAVAAGVVGVVALLASVVLAVGALLAALGADDGTLYDAVAGMCDVLVGPLRDAVSFGGPAADLKEALVAWGAGSIGYLAVSLVAQSLARPGDGS